jgi:hypothetical protein
MLVSAYIHKAHCDYWCESGSNVKLGRYRRNDETLVCGYIYRVCGTLTNQGRTPLRILTLAWPRFRQDAGQRQKPDHA